MLDFTGWLYFYFPHASIELFYSAANKVLFNYLSSEY